jgi:ubiquinone/menaquinone biosynthesis C-methylase UbiE
MLAERPRPLPDLELLCDEMQTARLAPFDEDKNSAVQDRALRQGQLKGFCNISGRATEFLAESDNFRESLVSPVSYSINRHRQLICALSMALFGHPRETLAAMAAHINQNRLKLYIAETNSALSDFLERRLKSKLFVSSEYFGPAYRSGEMVKGVRHEDLQHTSFADDTFDIIITSEVLEHVPDAQAAEKELMRILKPGGVHCFTVPFAPAAEHDLILADVDEQGNTRYFAEPQFHCDPMKSGGAILVYRIFSYDGMKRRFEAMGHEFSSYRFWSESLGIVGSDCWAHIARKRRIGAVTPEYNERLRVEIERYAKVENVHDLPAIFHVWSTRYVTPKVEEVLSTSLKAIEEFYAIYIRRYAEENPSDPVTIASIGAGNGDFEVRIAKILKSLGVERFRFQCMDVNPAMLERGREAAAKENLADHFEFLEIDVSKWSPLKPIPIVMAHHSLHHILELETTFANVKRAIGANGYFLSCDMIGRNGHMRWPEALEIVHDIWRTMPDRYKYNHQLKRFEELYENWDCSTEGFEGIRAQDILPLLVKLFKFEAFVAFGNISDLFVDRGFGHNLSPSNEEDVAFINRIGELNDTLISEGKIKPTQMIAVMRAGETRPCRYYLHWTPEFCVRVPSETDRPVAPETPPVPISGCGKQEGPAQGFWSDGWIRSPFEVGIRVDANLECITIEGYLPETIKEIPEVSVFVNGVPTLRQKAAPGIFSIQIPSHAAAGETLQLRMTCDTSYSPARSGHGDDQRELAIIVRKIRLVSR